MPHLPFSRARRTYSCARCLATIAPHQAYFRDDPHPFARMRGQAVVRHLCVPCVVGPDDAKAVTDALSSRGAHRPDHPGQLTLEFKIRPGVLAFPPRVQLVDITPQVLDILRAQPERLRELTPDAFEVLICERLERFGYVFARVGRHSFQRDGGIDLIAWQRSALVPTLIAVQAKHTTRVDRQIGPQPVRDLVGATRQHGLNAGLLVTNTTFSPDARWFAEKEPTLVRLRDITDLRRWLKGELSTRDEWREIPPVIELCPGVTVELPR